MVTGLIKFAYDLIAKRNEALETWQATRRLLEKCRSDNCYYVTVEERGALKTDPFFPSSDGDLCSNCKKSFPVWMKYIEYEMSIREIVELGSK
jgi:hypothetical protein